MGLIDFHAHLAPTLEARERLRCTMRRCGIEKSAVVAGGLLSPQALSHQIRYGGENTVKVPNLTILELANETDGKLLPFFFANPFSSVEEYRDLGERFFGLKLASAVHGIALTDARNLQYMELAERFHHPVYLHCLPRKGFDIEALTVVARNFPKIIFVLGHCGIGNCDFLAIDSIRDFPNIYLETSGGFASVVKYASQQLGIRRILFGSEYPLQEPSVEILKIQHADLSSNILNQNALTLLGLGAIDG